MVDFVVEVFSQIEEFITEVSTSPWFLLLLFIVVFSDSVLPLVPSEFTVIAGGVSASAGTLITNRPVLSLVLVIGVGALAAFSGDALVYWIGRGPGVLIRRLFFRGEKGKGRLEKTSAQIRKRGACC